jgi:fructose-bisphosphate aldolase, class II
MTLVNLAETLHHAETGGFAVGAFNITGEDMLFGIVDAAVQERSPLIISIAEAHIPFFRWASFMKMAVAEAEKTKVPIVIHLDHATRLDTIYRAFQLGFTSVMYDGSAYELETNITNTKHVVKIAHTLGISVEAELGHIGGTSDEVAIQENVRAHLTDPSLVPEFVHKTEIDALAISYGSAHGYYVKKPCLDFALLEEINNKVKTPLVLHGGTGLSDQDFLTSIRLGIRKINYGTDIFGTTSGIVRKIMIAQPDLIMYHDVCQEIRKAVCERVTYYMQLWGSSGKSWVYR